MSKQTKRIELSFEEYTSIKDLCEGDKRLLQAALEAQKEAYAPYSRFKVGAAVLLSNGIIVQGNNQENAAYPSGLCAERVALFAAAAQYPQEKVVALAIAADTTDKTEPASPCGACRQVMIEYENQHRQPMRVILGNAQSYIRVFDTVSYLLPFSFNGEALKGR